MTIKGITKQDEIIIQNILKPFSNKYDFYYYGSRVKGDFRALSDLDILIKSNSDILIQDIENIKQQFDESNLAYIVNLTNYNTIDNHFYKLIEKDLVKI